MKMLKIFFVAVILFLSVTLSCDTKNNNDQLSDSGQSDITARYGEPSEYFPMKIGTQWEYRIELSKNKETRPLFYGVTSWPTGENNLLYSMRGILYPFKNENDPQLILRVDSLATRQGPLQYPIGVKLSILRDDLGIYGQYNRGIYWAALTSRRFQVTEVILHDPRSPDSPHTSSWGGWGAKPGYSMSVKFFGSKPNIAIGVGEDSQEHLLFVGPERFRDSTALHFRRIVGKADRSGDERLRGIEPNYFDKPFTEDVWYLRGIGLICLIQKVDEEMTMIWRLEGY